MSDISPGSRVPADPAYPVDVPAQPVTPAYATPAYDTSPTVDTTYGGDEPSKPRQVAQQARESAGTAAADVKDTAKEQAQRVGQEARQQARTVASEVRGKINETARSQNDRLVSSIRQTADHLDEMRGTREDSPAAAVVSRVAEGGRQFADYLDRNGPDGVLREVEDFARRRPGAFLATALAAGFVVGRLGKSVAKADSAPQSEKPSTDTYSPAYSTPPTGYETPTAGYVDPATTGAYTAPVTPATTEYTATGTGIPAVVDETYPERRS